MSAKSRILIVDDDGDMNLLLQDFLTRQGYSVSTASSGSMALKLVHSQPQQSPWDLVISDVVMGSMNGIEFTKQLLAEHPKLRVVLMSSFGKGDVEREALASGAKAYLHKPFQLSEMATVVKEQLQKKVK